MRRRRPAREQGRDGKQAVDNDVGYDAAGELAAEYSTAAEDSGTAYLTADYVGRTRLVADANLNPLHFSAA